MKNFDNHWFKPLEKCRELCDTLFIGVRDQPCLHPKCLSKRFYEVS